jgi:putative membrane protein
VTAALSPPAAATGRAVAVPVGLAAVAVLLQVAYPLVHGTAREHLTVATVLVFAAASVAHAAVHRGARWASLYLLLTAGTGLVAEAVGTATGVPFGHYTYTGTLGAELLGVPLVVPLAWAMFAYPCLLVGQRLRRDAVGAALVGAWALASWDLFLDPQMVQAGHWRWTDVHVPIPGDPAVPVSNTLGWLVVAAMMLGALQRLARRRADDRVPAALFLWTYTASVLAFAGFFARPAVALLGGVAMGAVAVPYAVSLWRR